MSKQTLTILGLNSGTSADGLDLAVMKISRKGKSVNCKYLKGANRTYPNDLRSRILKLADSDTTALEEIISIDNQIGEFFGKAAAAFASQLSKDGITIDAVGSHGQTVRHVPLAKSKRDRSGTLQLGSLEQIAARVKKVTIGDFRQADVAIGNEGAPITVAAMQRLFGTKTESRLIVNIGGISNFFYFPRAGSKQTTLAADCGPGNVLCDILSQKLFNRKFDANGQFAQKGTPSKRILSLLLAEPFFAGKSVSTGRETFGRDFAERILNLSHKFELSKNDTMATAAELTVLAIANRIKPLLNRDKTIRILYLTGGGKKNKFFVRRLKEMLKDFQILPADQLGVNADHIEAAAYAVMAEAALRSEPLQTLFTGQNRKAPMAVLGKIVQPPVK